LDWVSPNIFQRILRSKESILFAAPCERVHTSLPYHGSEFCIMLLHLSSWLHDIWSVARQRSKPCWLPVFGSVFLPTVCTTEAC
jgi:hypothetical protein